VHQLGNWNAASFRRPTKHLGKVLHVALSALGFI
jgi:hypothetical protein